MLMPPISRYMTRQPWTVRHNASLETAADLMREHGVRHLPVLDARKLVGILSDRDVNLFRRLDEPELEVDDAMTQDVYTVRGDESLDFVANTMAERKIGCAVVVDSRGAVEGIFTTIDALRALADVLARSTGS